MNHFRQSKLVLVVPFHNEERFLPKLINSLRAQSVRGVPIVFIDNASTDRSAPLVRRCQEVKMGDWIFLEEKRIGKVHAMKTATEFARDTFGARYIGFVDADSYLGDREWIANSLELVTAAKDRFGYSYSPLTYYGFDELPVFKGAYLAYESVLRFLVENVGWLANGQGFVSHVDTLTRYFREAQITTEIDLRCALLALAEGREALYNPSLVVASGRRTTINARNFAHWCFYQPEFYSKKDINAATKLDLNAPASVEDLQPNMVGQFFRRRAIKITCRHLIPLALFDRSSFFLEKLVTVLGVELRAQLNELSRRFQGKIEFLLTEQFESMIQTVERNPASILVANRIEELMRARYGRNETISLAIPAAAPRLGLKATPLDRSSAPQRTAIRPFPMKRY